MPPTATATDRGQRKRKEASSSSSPVRSLFPRIALSGDTVARHAFRKHGALCLLPPRHSRRFKVYRGKKGGSLWSELGGVTAARCSEHPIRALSSSAVALGDNDFCRPLYLTVKNYFKIKFLTESPIFCRYSLDNKSLLFYKKFNRYS